MSTTQKHTLLPSSLDELTRLMKSMGVCEQNLVKFQNEVNAYYYDVDIIKENVSDNEASTLSVFCRDQLKDEYIFDIVKFIIDGRGKFIDHWLAAYCVGYDHVKVNFERICNAINHELYEKISHELMKRFDQKKYTTIEELLDALKKETKINDSEIKYILHVIERSINFFYPSTETTVQDVADFTISNGTNDVNINTLYDIYNVHNSLLFMNCNFQQYEPDVFIRDVADNTKLSHQLSSQNIQSAKFNLFCSFIIDDDMYSICNYFFAASHLVHKIRQTHSEYALKITIIPSRVVSVYDNNSTFSLNIESIDNYMKDYKPKILSKLMDVSVLAKVLKGEFKHSKSHKNIDNMQIVIDRREISYDKIYIFNGDEKASKFNQLDDNYCISMSSVITKIKSITHTIVKCHL
eukprot:249158_1